MWVGCVLWFIVGWLGVLIGGWDGLFGGLIRVVWCFGMSLGFGRFWVVYCVWGWLVFGLLYLVEYFACFGCEGWWSVVG